MTVIKIERIKDTYICTNQTGKKCQYNITTREAIGYKGKPIKKVNVDLAPFIHIVEGSAQKELIDRLISLELISWENLHSCCLYAFDGADYGEKCSALMASKPVWKNTLKDLKEKENRESDDLKDLIDYLYRKMLFSGMVTEGTPFKHLDPSLLFVSANSEEKIRAVLTEDWTKKIFVKWISKIDNDFEKIDKTFYLTMGYHLSTDENIFTSRANIYAMIYNNGLSYLYDMIEQKNNFPALAYDETKSIRDNYEQWQSDIVNLKNEEASRRFSAMQTERDYSYNNGGIYTVTVPTSYSDCQKISDTFNNCVAHFYWRNYLSTGERLVVIVNKDNKPAICVGIDRKTLKIVDYLRPQNRYVTDEDDKAFRTEYQNYLKSLL